MYLTQQIWQLWPGYEIDGTALNLQIWNEEWRHIGVSSVPFVSPKSEMEGCCCWNCYPVPEHNSTLCELCKSAQKRHMYWETLWGGQLFNDFLTTQEAGQVANEWCSARRSAAVLYCTPRFLQLSNFFVNLENPRYNETHHKALSVRLTQPSHSLTPLILFLRTLICAVCSILCPLCAKWSLFCHKSPEEEDDEEDKV